MTPPVLRVGLIGFGTVGSAFADALHERIPRLEQTLGVRLQLAQIAVQRPARHPVPDRTELHLSGERLAQDPRIDIVVEASGAPGAGEWLQSALERGAAVVTANKQALARTPALLQALASGHARLHCEAAVAAAVPVVRALRHSLAGEEVLSLRGVLNATSTWVLSAVERGVPFAHALQLAEAEGYAERGSSADLDGSDAAAKLAILATIAWQTPVPFERVRRRGIDADVEADVRASARVRHRVRLVASASREGGTIVARVHPFALEPDDALAETTGVQNVVEVHAALAGVLRWSGDGAGGTRTASALLGDLISAVRARALDANRLAA